MINKKTEPSKSTFNRHVLQVLNGNWEDEIKKIRKKHGNNYARQVLRRFHKVELNDICPPYFGVRDYSDRK